ncbi:MAG: glycosyltransferase family 2 protein [Actinomycetota bacterium]|nr:glycosyltransferase family 2 protein [Actinomycetota bacterium]
MVAGLLATVTAYLLGLLAAATCRRTCVDPPRADHFRFLLLVPAHDEEQVIADTLASLRGVDHPPDCVELIVIADRCSDDTARLAVAAGARVLERQTGSGGKGAALAWALERIDLDRFDAVVVVDADCLASPNLLSAIERRLHSGVEAVQTDYVVSNPEAGGAAALRYAAFRLVNTVRPLGKEAVGLSAGLHGTGMAFSRAVTQRHPWTTTSLIEDAEHHLALVAAGERVAFVPEASVSSPMPSSLRASATQQGRWESGRWTLLRRWWLPLMRAALRRRSVVQAHAAVEILVPPQSLLLSANALAGLAGIALRARLATRLALLSLAGQLVFVLGGLALVRAPPAAYRALIQAPALAVQKIWLFGLMLAGRGPRAFVRTEREADDTPQKPVVKTRP